MSWTRLFIMILAVYGAVAVAANTARASTCEEAVQCVLDHTANQLPAGGLCGACSAVPTNALVDSIKDAANSPGLKTACGASVNVAAIVDVLKDGFDVISLASSLLCAVDPNTGGFSSELNEVNKYCKSVCDAKRNILAKGQCYDRCDRGSGPNLLCEGLTAKGAELVCAQFEKDGNDDGWEEQCDCNFSAGGCSISKAAPYGKACKCEYEGAWTCSGTVVDCPKRQNGGSRVCSSNSLSSCLSGGGDCGGYAKKDNCDCDYSPGGCKISTAAPQLTACRCEYRGAWTCTGRPVRCNNESSRYCSYPDKSKSSCLLGGGDCDGYD